MHGRYDENAARFLQGHEQIRQHLEHLSFKIARGEQVRHIDAMKELVAHQYSQAVTYTNLLLVAGYAALFTVWKEMRDEIPNGPAMLVAALALTSAALFVLFELGKLILTTVYHRRIAKVLPTLRGHALFDQNPLAALAEALSERMYWWWVFMLIPTLLTGLSAAVILVWNLIAHCSVGGDL